MRKTNLAADLLEWYDTHARKLPWRVGPAARSGGQRPDPYRVWLSEIMLQQTTVAAVRDYFQRFTTRWPDIHALAAAPDDEVMAAWAGLGYYARARNLLACAREVVARGGAFPDSEDGLRALPGLGAYTVSVTVQDTGVSLGAPAISSNAGEVLRVDVRVSHAALDSDVVLSAFKANVQ